MTGTGESAGTRSVWHPALAGFAALLTGVGIARFAYSPLIPALVESGWFSPAEAAYLGAANYAGYLLGAVAAWRAVSLAHSVLALRGLMLVTALAMAACALPLSFWWVAWWRFTAGVTGGCIMILAAPLVLGAVTEARRGLVGGVIFAGVATGILSAGVLVPALLLAGLEVAWLGLGGLILLLTALAWHAWPQASQGETRGSDVPIAWRDSKAFPGLVLAYALIAAGLVPTMVFLVDYIARGLGQGVTVGSAVWAAAGLSGLIVPLLLGALADRIGNRRALQVCMLLLAACNALVFALPNVVPAIVGGVIIGGLIPGASTIALVRLAEIAPDVRSARTRMWSVATSAYAVMQGVAAYGYAYLFSLDENYALLFASGAVAALMALGAEAVLSPRRQRVG